MTNEPNSFKVLSFFIVYSLCCHCMLSSLSLLKLELHPMTKILLMPKSGKISVSSPLCHKISIKSSLPTINKITCQCDWSDHWSPHVVDRQLAYPQSIVGLEFSNPLWSGRFPSWDQIWVEPTHRHP
jgi:hypothetical protein